MMDRDSSLLGINPTLTIHWEITRILCARYLYVGPIYSESIPLYHHGTSHWRFALRSAGDNMEFYVLRYPSDDDGDQPLLIQFKVSLLKPDDEVYFVDSSDALSYSKPPAIGRSYPNESHAKNRILIPKTYIEINKQSMRLQCDIKVLDGISEIDDDTSDYEALLSDLDRHARDEDVFDLFLHSEDADYAFNSCMLKIRLPCYDALVSAYEEILKHNANAEERKDKCPFYKCFTTEYSDRHARHFYADTLTQAIFKMHYSSPGVHFIMRVSFTLDVLKQSLTPEVITALQGYLHLGTVPAVPHQDVEGLSNLARCLRLYDLVYILEGRPTEFNVITDITGSEWNYTLTQEHFRDWAWRLFEPIEKRGEFESNRKMVVKFLIRQAEDVLGIEIRCPLSRAFHIAMLCEITVKNLEGVVLKKSYSSHFYCNNEPWCPRVDLKRGDFPVRTLSCRFLGFYTAPHKPFCSDYVRFEPSQGDASVWNVRRLSSELSCNFGNDATSDVVLVAEGRKLEAHIFVLSARSIRFNEELRGKRFLRHKTTHLVRGIEYKTLVELVKYMYTGATDLENSHSVQKLRSAAQTFGVPSLARICQHFLMHKV